MSRGKQLLYQVKGRLTRTVEIFFSGNIFIYTPKRPEREDKETRYVDRNTIMV